MNQRQRGGEKMRKKIVLIGLFLLANLFMSSCMLPIFGNEPPIFKSNPPQAAKVGQTYTYQVEAIDDNDNLNFSLNMAPDGMSINSSTGLIEWTPEEDQIGKHDIQIKVSDGWHSITQDFKIEVNNVKLSSIMALPEKITILKGSTISITSVTAYYDDGTHVTISKSDCEYNSANTAIASVNIYGQVVGKIAGTTTVTVKYTEDGITQEDVIDVTVQNPPIGGG